MTPTRGDSRTRIASSACCRSASPSPGSSAPGIGRSSSSTRPAGRSSTRRELDAVVAGEVRGARLVLDDVVATRMPRLSDIVTRFAPGVDEVELHFAPDRLAPDTAAVAVPESMDEDVLMVRGPFPVGDSPCKLPPTARC